MSHPTGAYLACDIGGGGVAVRETFHDKEKLRVDERPIYEIIVPDDGYKYSDGLEGDHCLMMVSFSKPDVRQDLYYGGRKILEDGKIKFPYWDAIALEEAFDADTRQRERYLESLEKMDLLKDNEIVLYDTLEDTYMEIQKTIDELCSIEVTRSASGVDQFKAKPKKNAEGKTVYMHKDRATALLLAIYLYKSYTKVVEPLDVMTVGGTPIQNKGKGGIIFAPTNAVALAINKRYNDLERINEIIYGKEEFTRQYFE
jgi:hypothetical protein